MWRRAIRHAAENNLRDVDVDIPHGRVTVVTGVSGSGKSSLVFDVVFREAQRRYLETFSSYARQFMGKMRRPEVAHISGLAPAVAANVHVAASAVTPTAEEGSVPLSSLADGQSAEVVAIDEACQGFTRRRFLDLGLTPGTAVQPELSNAFGDPRAYRIRGTLIALRRDQASLIHVRTRS